MPCLANKSEFQEADFIRDLTGSYTSLRSYAGLESFDLSPLARHRGRGQIPRQSELVERSGNVSGCARACAS